MDPATGLFTFVGSVGATGGNSNLALGMPMMTLAAPNASPGALTGGTAVAQRLVELQGGSYA